MPSQLANSSSTRRQSSLANASDPKRCPPGRIVEQIRRCRDEVGAGVLDLSLVPPGWGDPELLMRSLELFGTKVLPHIRDI